MKKWLLIFVVVLLSAVSFAGLIVENGVALAQGEYVYLGGYPVGISLTTDGLIVVDTVDVNTNHGSVSPLKDVGVRKGDVLVSIDGTELGSIYGLKQTLQASDGEVLLSYKRDGVVTEVSVMPAVSLSGEKKLGVILKEDVSGIGTVTFVTLDGKFGALGHHVADGETGLCSELTGGKIFPINVDNVVKGDERQAGGLVGTLNRLANPLGAVDLNCNIGIFGVYDGKERGNLVRVAGVGEATIGKAQILTTICGDKPAFYDVEIVKVVEPNASKEKGLVLVVRDEDLIEKTGGIVQGMSGSPILQNGVLIGAVTHVFVGDSTRGYGVQARFMTEKVCQIKVKVPA